MKKNIWVINQFAGTPESGWGERHFFFSKYWINSGYNVKIISGSFNHVFSKSIKVRGLYEYENYDGVDFFWVKTPKYKAGSIFRFYSMFIFTLRVMLLPVNKIGLPDIVIVSSMPIFPILCGYFLKKRYGSVLLFEIRDIWPLTLQLLGNKSSNHPAVLFIGWFEKMGYRSADAVVSLLPNARAHIESIARRPVRFRYIPNGIDAENVGYEAIPEELNSRIPDGKFIIGYAGTIGLANALEYLIEAAARLEEDSDLFFVIVGDGYLKTKLLLKTQNLTNILFYPKIKKSQVQDLLKKFDVAFVGRNNSELFKHGVSANKYFDYMLSGKPILDSNNLIKDPVELSGCGIVVEPDNADAIVDGILEFKRMNGLERHTMGQRGKKYVLKNHSIKYLAEEYCALFQ